MFFKFNHIVKDHAMVTGWLLCMDWMENTNHRLLAVGLYHGLFLVYFYLCLSVTVKKLNFVWSLFTTLDWQVEAVAIKYNFIYIYIYIFVWRMGCEQHPLHVFLNSLSPVALLISIASHLTSSISFCSAFHYNLVHVMILTFRMSRVT